MGSTFHHVLKRLFLLRNIAVVFQLTTLFIVVFGINMAIPLTTPLFIISALAGWNGFIYWRLHRQSDVSEVEVVSNLTFDLTQLAALLYFLGAQAIL